MLSPNNILAHEFAYGAARETTCRWFRDRTMNGDLRWFAGCKTKQGISCFYTGRSTVCHWCGKPTVDRDAEQAWRKTA